MPSHGDASVVKLMDNNDENFASITQPDTGQQLHVIIVYPLDGKSVAKSQFWVAVTQVQNNTVKKIFLREAQKHRLISIDSAMRLLSSENKKDLSETLKESTKNGGVTTTVVLNTIQHIHNHPLNNNVNKAVATDSGDITNQSSSLEGDANVLTASAADQITIAALVQTAQLKSWGSIKVCGSIFFRKQVWMEAASNGLYLEGYAHTETDRLALFMRIPKSAHAHIRPEYRPIEMQKKVLDAAIKSESKITNNKIADDKSQSELLTTDLSEQELICLLMRVQQIEFDKLNMVGVNLALQSISNIGTIATENEVHQLFSNEVEI